MRDVQVITGDTVGVKDTRSVVVNVNVNEDDLDALARLLAETTAIDNERLPDRSLDEVIAKPWGWECRVFVDHLVDVWMLRIEAGEQTSLHAHLKKQTHLLCLSGEGVVRSIRERWTITSGAIVKVAPGAFHSTRATNGPLELIEVEMPRNKLDLVRLEDAYSRSTTLYETTSVVSGVCRLAAVPHLAGASMRDRSPDDRFRFDLSRAPDLRHTSGNEGEFYVPVGIQAFRTRRPVTGADLPTLCETDLRSGGEYLAITPTAGESGTDQED